MIPVANIQDDLKGRDRKFMQAAFDAAAENTRKNRVRIGAAVSYRGGQLLSVATNSFSISLNTPRCTAHAETRALHFAQHQLTKESRCYQKPPHETRHDPGDFVRCPCMWR